MWRLQSIGMDSVEWHLSSYCDSHLTFPSCSPAVVSIIFLKCKPNPAFINTTSWNVHCSSFSVQSLWYLFARNAITKYPRLGGWRGRNLLSRSPGDSKSQDQGMGRLGSFWGLWWKDLFQPLSRSVHGHLLSVVSLHHLPSVNVSTFSPCYKDSSHIRLGPTLATYLNLTTSVKTLMSKWGHILGH